MVKYYYGSRNILKIKNGKVFWRKENDKDE